MQQKFFSPDESLVKVVVTSQDESLKVKFFSTDKSLVKVEDFFSPGMSLKKVKCGFLQLGEDLW